MPGIRRIMLWAVIVAAILAFAVPASAVTTNDAFLKELTPGNAKIAQALMDHLNNQWAIINRAADSDKSTEKAESAVANAVSATDEANKTLADKQATRDAAQTSLDDLDKLIKELNTARVTMDAYDAASLRYTVAQEHEQQSSDALDAANDALMGAHALAEEAQRVLTDAVSKYEQSSTSLEALRAEVQALSESQTSSESSADGSITSNESSTDGPINAAEWLETRKADLAEAEKTNKALAQQMDAAAEQSARTEAKVKDAQNAYDAASDAENKALAEVEASSKALAEIKTEYDKLQLTREELDETAAKAEADHVHAVAALDKAEIELNAAKAAKEAESSGSDQAQSVLGAAKAEQSSAADALADLTSRWAKYQKYTGGITDGKASPVFDLLAAEEAAPDIYVVYLNGTDLYIFQGGKLLNQMSCLEGKHLGMVDITRNAHGKLALRYVAWDGKTHLQSMGADAPVLFTGVYETLGISSMLRDTTQFLGEGCDVRTTMMHPNTTLVQFGVANPLRHAPAN